VVEICFLAVSFGDFIAGPGSLAALFFIEFSRNYQSDGEGIDAFGRDTDQLRLMRPVLQPVLVALGSVVSTSSITVGL